MKAEEQQKPPRWAQRFLEWYCKPELLEDLEGDLNECFHRHSKSKGPGRAKFIYVIDVFKFFRSYTVRKPDFINLLINWIMLGSYIKTSGRSIVRNKLFSAINIIGLAISMSVGLLMIGLLSDMLSYDKFHTNGKRIYRVISNYQFLDRVDENYFASTSLLAGKTIQETITGIEDVAILQRSVDEDVKVGDRKVPLSGLWANEATFKVFTFPMLYGDPATALKDPFSIVLTEKSAKKLFGNEEALGKTIILLKDKEFTVTGVIEDIPMFSHLRFDMLVSLSTREITEKENTRELAWDNMWNTYAYLLLPPHADLESLQSNLNILSAKADKTIKNTKIKLALQPLHSIALGKDLNNSIGPVMGSSDVAMIAILAIIVLLSACFNYTNLSIARSIRRSREVGIRKVIGALKSHVFGQFVVEAVLISLMALVISVGLYMLLKPYVLSIAPRLQEMLKLDLTPSLILYFVLLAIFVGISAGFFPAIFFARINAIQVLKDASTMRIFRNLNMRKALIVFQYTISLIFIASTIIGFRQYKYLLSFNLGYTTENILNIRLQGNKADLLAKELAEIPEITGMSQSVMITSIGNYWGARMKYNNPKDSADVYYNIVDEKYLPMHDHKLLVGRNFTPQTAEAEESEVIVNEAVIKRFNIGDRDLVKALDEIVTVDGKKVKIIGVMKDYHYGKADSKVDEVIFRNSKKEMAYINAKVTPVNWPSTLDKIEKAWKKIDNVHPLDAKFYDDQIEKSYGEISALLKIIGFLAFLAICISSMGLFGMVVFTTETRWKEMSIRKVLGASDKNLMYLLSKGFLLLLFISAFIALPATYIFFDQVALPEMKNHAPINIPELLIGLVAVLIIALIMIGSQALKVARSNPAEVLKGE